MMALALREFKGSFTSDTAGVTPNLANFADWELGQFGVFVNTADNIVWWITKYREVDGLPNADKFVLIQTKSNLRDALSIDGITPSAYFKTLLAAVDSAAFRNLIDFNAAAISATAASYDTLGSAAAAAQRANHTGTQLASTISDFNATAVSATAASYDPVGSASAAQAAAVQRANHTGTQTVSTISDFTSSVNSTISARTFIGSVGTTAYTIDEIVTALKNASILAS
jgi:hypothetical protein